MTDRIHREQAAQAMTNGSYPDVYADSVSIASNAYGWALTFLLTDPPLEGQAAGSRVVARVRLSPELVTVLADALGQAQAARTAASTSE